MSELWRTALAESNPELAVYIRRFIDALVWMKDVPEIQSGEALWHMHPVVFLDATSHTAELINVDAFLSIYESQHVLFSLRTPGLNAVSKNNLKKLLININEFYSHSINYKPNVYKISYMLATARHEAYHFLSGEYFSERPEVGDVSYFNKYDPVLADTERRRFRARLNGNTE